MLIKKPQYAKYCDWNKFDTFDWHILLNNHPRLIKHCDAEMLEEFNWEYLLHIHHELEAYKPKKFKL
ncbi:MAG: hypothetical protein ACPL2D_10620 [Ignavibacteria bacterium]